MQKSQNKTKQTKAKTIIKANKQTYNINTAVYSL
jgi:hypothetical protein